MIYSKENYDFIYFIKYIKSYHLFEELNYETYASASKKLFDKGYDNRANKLKEKTIDVFFEKFFDGLKIYKDLYNYPDVTFFYKCENNVRVVYMEDDMAYKRLFCSHYKVWDFLENFLLHYEPDIGSVRKQVQKLIRERVEKHFNISTFLPISDIQSPVLFSV